MVKLPRFRSGRQKAGFLVVIGLCLVGGLILIGPKQPNNLPSSQPAPQTTQASGKTSTSQTASGLSANSSGNSQSATSSASPSNQTTSQSATKTNSVTSSQSPTSGSSAPVTNSQVTATLQINGVVQGQVTLASGATQCDLLAQALTGGVISQLTMQYNPSYKSRGVYQINNQGDASNMLWVYKVNGSEPPVGCDGVTVHDNDSVNWQYLRS